MPNSNQSTSTLLLQYTDGSSKKLVLPNDQKLLCGLSGESGLLSITGKLPPALEMILISGCKELIQLPKMPALLQRLNLQDCHGLKHLPKMPTSLQNFNVTGCTGLTKLPKMPTSLKVLNVVGCTQLTRLPTLPASLRRLYVHTCNALTRLPKLPDGLEQLYIYGCPVLSELPQLPSSLQTLSINHSNNISGLPEPLSSLNLDKCEISGDGIGAWLPVLRKSNQASRTQEKLSDDLIVKLILMQQPHVRGYLAYSFGLQRFRKHAGSIISVEIILEERNAELRRACVETYGWTQFMLDAGAGIIHEDDFGSLYRLNLIQDHPLMMVKLVNATAEEDGSYKDYYLMVDPQLRPMWIDDATGEILFGEPQELTARNAVASTFGLRGEEYLPEFET